MTSTARGKCIYCKRTFDDTRGQGDHFFPAAMGEFANLVRFRGVCVPCNNGFSPADEQLCRCGPESFMLRVSDPPRRGRDENTAWVAAHGAPPPRLYTERAGAKLIAKPIGRDPRLTQTPDQIVIEDQNGQQHQIPVSHQVNGTTVYLNAAAVRRKMNELGITGQINVRASASEENWERVLGLINELWPTAKVEDLPRTEAGLHVGSGPITFTVTDLYFRGLARMAFHYYLCYNARGLQGSEPQFHAIRRFIKDGGEPEPFFTSPERSPVYFGTPFGDLPDGGAITPGSWFHLLAFDDSHESIVVMLHLFLGPGWANQPHYVEIGPSPATSGGGTRAHMLSWTPGATSPGSIKEVQVTQGTAPDRIVGTLLAGTNAADTLYTLYKDAGWRT